MSVKVSAIDRRTIELRFPASVADLAAVLGDVNGYELTGATLIESGHQRDPYTVGVRLILERKGPRPLNVTVHDDERQVKAPNPTHAPACYRG